MKRMMNNRGAAVGALLVAMTLVAGCGGKEQRLAAHLEKGKTFLAQGQIEKARIEIKNVLQIDPRMAEAYFVAGLIEEKQHEWQKAFGYFLRAVEFDPANQRAQIRLGRLYLFGGDLARADEGVQKVLKTTPENLEAQSLAAAILAKRGDVDAAMDLASKVIDKDASQVDAVAMLAGLRAARGDTTVAEQVLARGIVASPGNTELRQALIALYASRNELDKAEAQYVELVKVDPEAMDNRVGLARVQTARGDLVKAEETLRQAIQAKPDDDSRYLLLADFIGSRKSPAEAEQYLTGEIKSRPRAYALQFRLSSFYRSAGKADDAEQIDRRIIEADRVGPDGIRARSELAESRMQRGHPEEAAVLIAEVLKENPRDNQALMLRGQLALDRGDALGAVADFRSVYKDQPNSVAVMTQLARAHLGNGEPELAKEMLGKAVALYPKQPEVRTTLAELKATTGDASGALEDLEAVLKQEPKNYRALNAKVDIQSAKRNWKEAERTLAELKAAYPEDARVYQRTGSLYLMQKRFDLAIAAYEAALTRVPGAIEPLAGLSNVYIAQQRPQLAIARIEKSLRDVPGNYMAYALIGHVESARKQYGQAEAAFRKAVEVNPNVSGTHQELASHLTARGQVAPAEQALQDGLRTLPHDGGLSLQLAELYRVDGKTDQSIGIYEEILKREPGNDLAANNLASMLLDLRADRSSHERALQLVRHFESSRNPAYRDSLGWAYFRLGDYAQALPQLRKAVERAPQAAIMQYHLGMALYRNGDLVSAKPYLRKAIDAKAEFPGLDEARKILAES